MFNEFLELEKQGFIYKTRIVDFGKEFELTLPNKITIINWSYTARDGIYVKIKSSSPYKVLFEYLDGAPIINDNREMIYVNLINLTDALDEIRNRIRNTSLDDAFKTLNKTIIYYVSIINEILTRESS